jgi:hypothetical protein
LILLAKSGFAETGALTPQIFKLVPHVNRAHFRLRQQYRIW